MTWQSEVSPTEWAAWQDLARKTSKAKRMPTSLGPEDYAASAIERLLEQKERPANVEAWLRKTINNQYIDRFRKIQARGGTSNRELTDEEWEIEMVTHAVGSPSGLVRIRESVDEVLSVLSAKEKEILILSTAGYSNHEIAMHLGYRTNKIVATRLGQINQKLKEQIHKVLGELI
jgi:RNA polymerase sigma factor (sigma-70 family)